MHKTTELLQRRNKGLDNFEELSAYDQAKLIEDARTEQEKNELKRRLLEQCGKLAKDLENELKRSQMDASSFKEKMDRLRSYRSEEVSKMIDDSRFEYKLRDVGNAVNSALEKLADDISNSLCAALEKGREDFPSSRRQAEDLTSREAKRLGQLTELMGCLPISSKLNVLTPARDKLQSMLKMFEKDVR